MLGLDVILKDLSIFKNVKERFICTSRGLISQVQEAIAFPRVTNGFRAPSPCHVSGCHPEASDPLSHSERGSTVDPDETEEEEEHQGPIWVSCCVLFYWLQLMRKGSCLSRLHVTSKINRVAGWDLSCEHSVLQVLEAEQAAHALDQNQKETMKTMKYLPSPAKSSRTIWRST